MLNNHEKNVATLTLRDLLNLATAANTCHQYRLAEAEASIRERMHTLTTDCSRECIEYLLSQIHYRDCAETYLLAFLNLL